MELLKLTSVDNIKVNSKVFTPKEEVAILRDISARNRLFKVSIDSESCELYYKYGSSKGYLIKVGDAVEVYSEDQLLYSVPVGDPLDMGAIFEFLKYD